MEEIVYFEINNWFAGRDYPNDEIFYKWIKDCQFRDNEWCKQNKLCVMCGAIDMSMNYCVAAPKSWTVKTHKKKYSDFICQPDEDGYAYGHISGWEFPEYKEENFGVTWNNSWWGDEDDED